MGNIIKGIGNKLGLRKKGSSKKTQGTDQLSGLDDSLQEPVWSTNPLYDDSLPKPQVTQPQQTAPVNNFAQTAQKKADKKGFFGLGKRAGGKKVMHDRHIGEVKQGSDDVGQSVHEVQRINYNRQIGDTGTNEGFFKPEKQDFHGSVIGERSGIGKFDAMNGDAVLEESRLIARSNASTRLDQKLGLGTIAHEFEAEHNGQRGVVSGKVQGKALAEISDDFDISNPETQRGMSDLQLFDYLSGQVDRHDGNIYIDEGTGKVTGIDNDLSWGKNNDVFDGQAKSSENVFGLPSHIHKDTAERYANLSEKDLGKLLSGRKGDSQQLNNDEIEAAKERLRHIQAYLRGDEVQGKTANIVDGFDQGTYDDILKAMPGKQKGYKNMDDTPLNYQGSARADAGGYMQRLMGSRFKNGIKPDWQNSDYVK